MTHPLARVLADAANGTFPAPDGAVEVLPPAPGRSDAVVAFTAHNVVAAPVTPAEALAQLAPDDLGAPMSPAFLSWLGERLGSPAGVLDVVLAVPEAERPSSTELELERVDAADNHRVERALRYRDGVEVWGVEGAVLAIGRGLAGRVEVAIEVEPDARGRGLGRALARDALALAPPDEAVFAQVSPGNVASLRAFLAAGYRPIGSEVLFLRK